MKSLTWLHKCLLVDLGKRCGTDTQRDRKTLSRRVKQEGLGFLTMTLPNFCTDFESCLDEGRILQDAFKGFRRHQGLPAFLQGFLKGVFDPCTGYLRVGPDIECIFAIRQICLLAKKVNIQCSPTREWKAIHQFKRVEKDLLRAPFIVSSRTLEGFGQVSDILWSETLSGLCFKLAANSLVPKHGPGATAEKISGNSKFRLETWHTRLEPIFPITAYGLPTQGSGEGEQDWLSGIKFLEPGEEPPVRVTLVPKTLKAPRVIAIEPVCMQYTQQAILQALIPVLESSPLTKGRLNYTDQSVNRNLALEGSEWGHLATLDLTEASDRVHKDFVWRMLRSVPLFRDAVMATRTQRAILPDGDIIHLAKFASMGSALCFPIESMMFYTLCITSRLQNAKLPVTRRNILKVIPGIHIYGDDIIVPTDEVSAIMTILEEFSLLVNDRKSHWSPKPGFRESCGMDAYAGVDITPVYCRHLPPHDRSDASGIVSWVSLANQLYNVGLWGVARDVRDYVEACLKVSLPHVRDTASCLGWVDFKESYSYSRTCSNTHRPQVKGFVVTGTEQDDPLDGYPALMKFFLKIGEEPIIGEHLERSMRPGSANIKYRWAHPC